MAQHEQYRWPHGNSSASTKTYGNVPMTSMKHAGSCLAVRASHTHSELFF